MACCKQYVLCLLKRISLLFENKTMIVWVSDKRNLKHYCGNAKMNSLVHRKRPCFSLCVEQTMAVFSPGLLSSHFTARSFILCLSTYDYLFLLSLPLMIQLTISEQNGQFICLSCPNSHCLTRKARTEDINSRTQGGDIFTCLCPTILLSLRNLVHNIPLNSTVTKPAF